MSPQLSIAPRAMIMMSAFTWAAGLDNATKGLDDTTDPCDQLVLTRLDARYLNPPLYCFDFPLEVRFRNHFDRRVTCSLADPRP